MKVAAASLIAGFVPYPIVYDVPVGLSGVEVGRLLGGGLALSAVTYVALWICLGIVRKITGRNAQGDKNSN